MAGASGRGRSGQEEVTLEPPAPGRPPALGVLNFLCHAAPSLFLGGGPRLTSFQLCHLNCRNVGVGIPW